LQDARYKCSTTACRGEKEDTARRVSTKSISPLCIDRRDACPIVGVEIASLAFGKLAMTFLIGQPH